jgi:hypothetical protein
MKRLQQIVVIALAMAAGAWASFPVWANDAVASDCATVLIIGPRPTGLGKAFFDVEGRNNPGSTAPAFGVLEYNSTDLGLGQVSEVDSVSVTLWQSEFGDTSRGPIRFFITTDTTTSIQPDDVSPAIVFDTTVVNGVGSQLATLYDLGQGEFLPVRTGWADRFTFPIQRGSPVEAYLIEQINSGGIIRVVIAPDMDMQDDELVGASYAGTTHDNPAFHPRLTVVGQ